MIVLRSLALFPVLAGVLAVPAIEKRYKSDPGVDPGPAGLGNFFDWKSAATYASFYNPARGACGDIHTDADHVVAVNSGTLATLGCGARIKVTNPARAGSEVVVTVVDLCVGCGPEHIDMSISAFDVIGPLGAGKMAVEYQVV